MKKKLIRLFSALLSTVMCSQGITSLAMNRPNIAPKKRPSKSLNQTETNRKVNWNKAAKYGVIGLVPTIGFGAGSAVYFTRRSKTTDDVNTTNRPTLPNPGKRNFKPVYREAPVYNQRCVKYFKKYDFTFPVFTMYNIGNTCFVDTFLGMIYNSLLVDLIRNLDIQKCGAHLAALKNIVFAVDTRAQLTQDQLTQYFRALGWNGSQESAIDLFNITRGLLIDYYNAGEPSKDKAEISSFTGVTDELIRQKNGNLSLALQENLNEVVHGEDNDWLSRVRVFGNTFLVYLSRENLSNDAKKSSSIPKENNNLGKMNLNNFEEFFIEKKNGFLINYDQQCQSVKFKLRGIGLKSGNAGGGHWRYLWIDRNTNKLFICDDCSSEPYEIDRQKALEEIENYAQGLVYDVIPIDSQEGNDQSKFIVNNQNQGALVIEHVNAINHTN